jgi:hypothetical protein
MPSMDDLDQMTWVTCEDPKRMLQKVGFFGHDRALKLLAAACWRMRWLGKPTSADWEVVDRVEKGESTKDFWPAINLAEGTRWLLLPPYTAASCWIGNSGLSGVNVASLIRDVICNPFVCGDTYHLPSRHLTPDVVSLAHACRDHRVKVKCPHCQGRGYIMSENTEESTVYRNVDAFYRHSRHIDAKRCSDCHTTGYTNELVIGQDRLNILADALEDAGCNEQMILGHLRGECTSCSGGTMWPKTLCLGCNGASNQKKHVLGCWAVEACLP